MTESERILRRQAAWQKSRQAIPWSEKIRQAERLRPSIEAMRKERQRLLRREAQAPGHGGHTVPD